MALRRRSAFGLGLCAGILALTACSGDAVGSNPGVTLRDGPLDTPPPHAWAIGQPIGATFTDGLETLEFEGTEPAELVDVRLIGDPDLELVGVALAGPDRTYGSIQLMEGFPPRHKDLEPNVVINDGIGHPMTAQTRHDIGWELLLGIRVSEPGRHVRTAIEVTYTAAGQTYVEQIPAAMAICASRDNHRPRDCAVPPLPG